MEVGGASTSGAWVVLQQGEGQDKSPLPSESRHGEYPSSVLAVALIGRERWKAMTKELSCLGSRWCLHSPNKSHHPILAATQPLPILSPAFYQQFLEKGQEEDTGVWSSRDFSSLAPHLSSLPISYHLQDLYPCILATKSCCTAILPGPVLFLECAGCMLAPQEREGWSGLWPINLRYKFQFNQVLAGSQWSPRE